MNFEEIDFYLVFDPFILRLIGMGPKIALVLFLDMTADVDGETNKKVANSMVRAAVGTALILVVLGGFLMKLLHFSPGGGIHRGWDRAASHCAQYACESRERALA
jgi:multiple antibiotic resistance protein